MVCNAKENKMFGGADKTPQRLIPRAARESISCGEGHFYSAAAAHDASLLLPPPVAELIKTPFSTPGWQLMDLASGMDL
jgi:hypothetical protein